MIISDNGIIRLFCYHRFRMLPYLKAVCGTYFRKKYNDCVSVVSTRCYFLPNSKVNSIIYIYITQELFMSTLRASRAILLLSLHIKQNPQSEITFVTNLLSLRSSVLHSKLRFKATLEKHFYPGGIQLSYTDVFSVKCLKNNPNMEITNNYHQDAANHICRRQCDGIGLYLTLQRSMKT